MTAPTFDQQLKAMGGKAAALYAWDPVNNTFVAVAADANGLLSIGGLNLTGDVNVDAKALANAAAPTLAEGSENPLSADLTGNLRTKDTAAGIILASILTALALNHTDEAALHTDIATGLHGDLVNLLTQTVLAAGANVIGATKDGGPNWTTVWGVTAAPVTSADATGGVMVTDAPTGGQKIVADDIIFSNRSAAALDFTLKCETNGAIIFGPVNLPANSTQQFTPRGKGWKLATADKKVQLFTSAIGNVSAHLGYHSEA